MNTLSPMTAVPPAGILCPINTPGYRVQFSPITVAGLIMIGPQCHIVKPLPAIGGECPRTSAYNTEILQSESFVKVSNPISRKVAHFSGRPPPI